MAAVSNKPADIFQFQDRGWSKEECTDERVRMLVVKYFRAICDDARMRSLIGHNDVSVLESGPWYANSYMQLLTKHGCEKRLDFLRKKGSFYHGRPPKKFEHVLVDPKDIDYRAQMTSKRLLSYTLKKGVLPSEALNELLPGRASTVFFIDCQMATQIALYAAIRTVFGKALFDSYFSRAKNPLRFDYNLGETPLKAFIKQRVNSEPPILGELCYYKNIPAYWTKHTDGNAAGWHVMSTAEEEDLEVSFDGFGLGYHKSTEMDIYRVFAESFNEEPIQLTELLPEEIAAKRIKSSLLSEEQIAAVDALVVTPEGIRQAAKEHPDLVGRLPVKTSLSVKLLHWFLKEDSDEAKEA